MTVSATAVRHPASDILRSHLVYLSERGVEYAHGRVIVSNTVPGEPPAGHDQVSSGVYAGHQPLTDAEEARIRQLIAQEMVVLAQQVLLGDCDTACLIEGEYSIAPIDGEAMLTIATYGLVDRVACVTLN
jgi:hypothetical protein